MNHVHTTIESPVGALRLHASDQGLRAILWPNDTERVAVPASSEAPHHPVLAAASQQLREYFDGERTTFDLPLDLHGTEFQKAAWRALADIPYGSTVSYGEQAERLGRPGAARAVGSANGLNPISIVLPCHRVIGSNGDLTGFAGGLDTKRRLLALESGSLFGADA